MIDGIKRDRMPWAGDQALSTLANALRARRGRRRGRRARRARPPRPRIRQRHRRLLALVGRELRPAPALLRRRGRSPASEADRLDGVRRRPRAARRPRRRLPSGRRSAADSSTPDRDPCSSTGASRSSTGAIRWRCRCSGTGRCAAPSACSGRTGHPGAERWAALADTLEATLRDRAWLARHGRWADYLDARESRRPATYANFLAVLAGMHDTDVVRGTDGAAVDAGVDVPPGVIDAVRVGVAGTPFMTAFRLRALLAAGDAPAVLDEVRSTWGAMLDRGPGTFWEESSIDDEPFAMYGRAFGRSLCHAWASGPAAILPEAVLGLRPLDDGWSRFEVRPDLGDLEWAAAVVPAPWRRHRRGRRRRVGHGAGAVGRGARARGPCRSRTRRRRMGATALGGLRRGNGGPRGIRGMIETIHAGCPCTAARAGIMAVAGPEWAGPPGEAADGSECPRGRGRGIRVGGHGLERAQPAREGRAGHGGARDGRDRRARVRAQRRGATAAGGAQPQHRTRRARRAEPVLHRGRARGRGSRRRGRHDHPARQQRRERRSRALVPRPLRGAAGARRAHLAARRRRVATAAPAPAGDPGGARRPGLRRPQPLVGVGRRRGGRGARGAAPHRDRASADRVRGRSRDHPPGRRSARGRPPGRGRRARRDPRGRRDRVADGARGSRRRRGHPRAAGGEAARRDLRRERPAGHGRAAGPEHDGLGPGSR